MANEQREFWSAVARKYDEVVDIQIGPKTRSLVRERMRLEPHLGTVVEFGAGTGYYSAVLAERANTLLGTDISEGMLEVAKKVAPMANISFQTADCQSSGLLPDTFDTAFISLVIHFTDPCRTIQEMHRVLKAGGILIIANLDMPALKGLNRLRCLVRIIFQSITKYRVKPPRGFGSTALSEKSLIDLLHRSGFKVTSSETFRDDSLSSYIPVQYVRAIKI